MSALEENVDITEKTTADIDYRIASTRDERAAAFRLVYRSYLQAGLGGMNPYEMRVTPYHLLPTTEVFVALCHAEVFFTMSLVVDGELGLPMESVYRDLVQQRRRQGVVMAEVSCLADRRSQFRGFFPVFLRLSRLVAQYAWHHGVDQLMVAVHPRHARFYRRLLNFKPIGEQRDYPTVRNRPAVALCLDLVRLPQDNREAYDTLFFELLPEEQLVPQPISPADSEYFRAMVDPSFAYVPLGSTAGSLDNRSSELEAGVA